MKRAILGLALAAILPVSAQASELNYNYVEGTYASSEILDTDFDGFGIAGSFAINDNWYATADYRRVDNNDADVDLDMGTLNIGYRHHFTDKADFLAELGYVNMGIDLGGFGSDSENGFRAAAGVRGMMSPKFEGTIKVNYTELNDFDGGFGFALGTVYHLNETWGLTGGVETLDLDGESVDTWSIGVRASF